MHMEYKFKDQIEKWDFLVISMLLYGMIVWGNSVPSYTFERVRKCQKVFAYKVLPNQEINITPWDNITSHREHGNEKSSWAQL